MPENFTVQITPDGSKITFDPTARAGYQRFQPIDLRYNDLDPLGHVTSLAFLNCFETARVQFINDTGQLVDNQEFGWMLVKLDTDYLGQLHFPGKVDVGTRIVRAGRSSLTTMQGLFSSDRCCATLRSILVHVERGVDRSAEIPADLRTRLWQVDGTIFKQGDAP